MATAVLGAGNAATRFDAHEALCGAGVLFLLPALLAQGLLKTKEVYQVPDSHYYGLESHRPDVGFYGTCPHQKS